MKSAIKLGEGRGSRGSGRQANRGVRDSDGVTFAPPVFLPFIFPVRNINICEAGPDEGQRVLKDFERLHNNSYNNRAPPPSAALGRSRQPGELAQSISCLQRANAVT